MSDNNKAYLKSLEEFVVVDFSSSSDDEILDGHEFVEEEEKRIQNPCLSIDWKLMTVFQREEKLREYTRRSDKQRASRRNEEQRNLIAD